MTIITIKCDLCNKNITPSEYTYGIETLNHSTYAVKKYTDVCLECYYKINSLIEKIKETT